MNKSNIKELELVAAEQRRQYHQNWRKNNKAKTKIYNQTYWLRKADKVAAEKYIDANKQD